MTVTAGQTTIATTAGGTLIATNGTSVASITIHVPTGGQSVFLGASGVATTTGLEVEAGATVTLQLAPGDALYGIVAATTQAVSHVRV